ncbi:hypothetical protein C8J57DRAFT_1520900 [Mycena rebaudengoi]|nr:hypothetical protein C8J57DRAFT_1520900 [Mycena rebaudengoi]
MPGVEIDFPRKVPSTLALFPHSFPHHNRREVPVRAPTFSTFSHTAFTIHLATISGPPHVRQGRPNYPSPRSPPAPPTRPRQRPAHCRRAALCGAVTPYVALPPLTTTAAPQLHQPPSARQFTTVTPTAGPHCDLPVLDSSAACGTSVPRAPSTGQRDFDAALTFDACSVSQRQFSFASGVELTFVAPLDLPTSTGIYGSNQ